MHVTQELNRELVGGINDDLIDDVMLETFAGNGVVTIRTDLRAQVTGVNRFFRDVYGYEDYYILGKNCNFLQFPNDPRNAAENAKCGQALRQGLAVSCTFFNHTGPLTSDTEVVVCLQIYPILTNGAISGFLGLQQKVRSVHPSQTFVKIVEGNLLTEAAHNSQTNVNAWYSSVLPSPYAMHSVLPNGGVPLPVSLNSLVSEGGSDLTWTDDESDSLNYILASNNNNPAFHNHQLLPPQSREVYNDTSSSYSSDVSSASSVSSSSADFSPAARTMALNACNGTGVHARPHAILNTNAVSKAWNKKSDAWLSGERNKDKAKRKRQKTEKERQQKCAFTRKSRLRQKKETEGLEVSLQKMTADVEEKSAEVAKLEAELKLLRQESSDAKQEKIALQDVFTSLTSKRESRAMLSTSRARFLGREQRRESNNNGSTDTEAGFSDASGGNFETDSLSSSDDGDDCFPVEQVLKRSDLDEMRNQIKVACTFVARLLAAPSSTETARMCTRDAVFNCSSSRGCTMVTHYLRYIQKLKDFMPDLCLENPEVTFSEELVMLCGQLRGTHTSNGGVSSMEPANPPRGFESRALFMFGFNRKGLIVNLSKTFNVNELHTQLGWAKKNASPESGSIVGNIANFEESLFSLMAQRVSIET
jgi:hypothetical protein